MKKNNNKILIGSVSKLTDKRVVLGSNPAFNQSVILLDILLSNYDYAKQQLDEGNLRYNKILHTLIEKINKLKYECPEICLYKNRLVYITKNTPPEIEDNIIDLPFKEFLQDVARSEIIKDYFDKENNGISEIVIIDKGEKLDLQIDNTSTYLGSSYQPNISKFEVKYDIGENKKVLVFNKHNEKGECEPNIILVDKEEYNPNYSYYDWSKDEFVTQKITEEILTLPNDTIIYVHIDTSSMNKQDQKDLEKVAIEWFHNYAAENPEFKGHFIVNTAKPSDIYGLNSPEYLTNTTFPNLPTEFRTNPSVERWVANPQQALGIYLAQKNIPVQSEEDFLNKIKGKSVVVMSFIDETHPNYHERDQQVIVKPHYVEDYNNFVNKVEPQLNYFKGILYPIIRTNQGTTTTFVINAISALECKSLTNSEIDALLGPDLVSAYTPYTLEHIYTALEGTSPYAPYPKLKSLGWEGNFTKKSPASEVINGPEFSKELDSVLAITGKQTITTVSEDVISAENLGTCLSSHFDVKVKDNHVHDPLYSKPATITFNFCAECQENDCVDSKETVISLEHREDNYIFKEADFNLSPGDTKIILESASIQTGTLIFNNLDLKTVTYPIVVEKGDIGKLIYRVDKAFQGSASVNMTYTSSKDGANICPLSSTVLNKLENPNKPPTVTVKSVVLKTVEPDKIWNNVVLDATVNYEGFGGYTVEWFPITLGGSTITDSSVEDLSVSNVTYNKPVEYKIVVTTAEDGFTSEATGTIQIIVENTAPRIASAIINTPFEEGDMGVNKDDIFHNYTDAEGNGVGTYKFNTVPSSSFNMKINNASVSVGDTFSSITGSTVSIPKIQGKKIFVKSIPQADGSCTGHAYGIDKDKFVEGFRYITAENELLYESVSGGTADVQSVLVVHLDNSSMSSPVRAEIRKVFEEWNAEERPDVKMVFSSETTNSSGVPFVNAPWAVERWLTFGLVQGLMLLAEEDGTPITSGDKAALLNYASGKRVSVLSFVDDTTGAYNSSGRVGNDNSTFGSSYEVTSGFIEDYNLLKEIVAEMDVFKGLSHPVRDGDSLTNHSNVHNLLSLIPKIITDETELIAAVGGQAMKGTYVTEGTWGLIQTWFAKNPFAPVYNELPDLGWKFNHTVIAKTPEEVRIRITREYITSTIETALIVSQQLVPLEDLGTCIQEDVVVSVADNHGTKPLWSTSKTVTLKSCPKCDTEDYWDKERVVEVSST